MKKIIVIISLWMAAMGGSAQIQSDCTIPAGLDSVYARDIANMAVRRMMDLNHPDMAYVNIPQAWKDTIGGGLAAILNCFGLPERDTVFNLYCVHDNTSYPETNNELLVKVDTTYAWTQAWQNLQTLTGDPFIDNMMTAYSLEVTDFYNWSFGNYALLHTDETWNTYALMDSLEIAPGIIYCDPNSIIGDAGKIQFSTQGNDRYFDFYFEFNDCFDGCDNYRKWQFMVTPACEVNYLGFIDWGFFGIEPLPAPINCNLFTFREDRTAVQVSIFPNPSKNRITINNLDSGHEISDVKLTDLCGQVLRKIAVSGYETIHMDVSDLDKGTYLLMLSDRDGIISTQKVLKQ